MSKEVNTKKVNDKNKKAPAKKTPTKKIVKKSGENKVLVWFKNHKKELISGVVGLVVGIIIMVLLTPTRIAKLSNGKQVVLELNNTSITAEDLYEELKSSGGLSALINLMDSAILNDKYDLEEEAQKYADEQSAYYYNMYEQYYGYTKEEFLEANSFETEEDFIEYLKNEFLYNRYYEDYLASIITDEEIEEYYNNNVFGTRYVYVFSSTEKENSLEKVRKALKKGTKISKLEDKYADVVVNELGEVDFTAASNFSATFIENVSSLEKNQYSAVFEDDTFGYVVVYVSDVKDKIELVDAEEDIIDVISAEKDAADETLYYKAYQELREAYGMKFYDEALEKEYEAAMKPYLEEKTTKESE